jgi:hypothetical protein
MTEIQPIPIGELELDRENPRLTEFGITQKSTQKEILEVLWDEMAVDELMYSIVSNGFWNYEPLIVLESPNSEKYIVLGECLKQWAHEVHEVSGIAREKMFEQLSAVETENK